MSALAGSADMAVVTSKLSKRLSCSTAMDFKKSKKLHKQEKKVFLYLMEIWTVETLLEENSVAETDILCFNDKKKFFKELKNYVHYTITFPGEYVHLVKCSRDFKPSKWLIWCGDI